VEDLKKQLAEAAGGAAGAGGTGGGGGGARKKSVKFAAEPETVITSASTTTTTTATTELESKIANLERALEDAAKERLEILEAAGREIEYHRSIAADLEQVSILPKINFGRKVFCQIFIFP
jgi:hypothetical protein